MIMGNLLGARSLLAHAMATTSDPDAPAVTDETECRTGGAVGMNHTTVVPRNFDRETTDCPRCGRPLGEHE